MVKAMIKKNSLIFPSVSSAFLFFLNWWLWRLWVIYVVPTLSFCIFFHLVCVGIYTQTMFKLFVGWERSQRKLVAGWYKACLPQGCRLHKNGNKNKTKNKWESFDVENNLISLVFFFLSSSLARSYRNSF